MAATAAPSRAMLSRWMTATLSEEIGNAPEKKCASGAIYCQLLEAVRPGTINLAKVNTTADSEHAALAHWWNALCTRKDIPVVRPVCSLLNSYSDSMLFLSASIVLSASLCAAGEAAAAARLGAYARLHPWS